LEDVVLLEFAERKDNVHVLKGFTLSMQMTPTKVVPAPTTSLLAAKLTKVWCCWNLSTFLGPVIMHNTRMQRMQVSASTDA
jgi:hypothetical protein